MFRESILLWLLVGQIGAGPSEGNPPSAAMEAQPASVGDPMPSVVPAPAGEHRSAAGGLVAALPGEELRRTLTDLLAKNPRLARARRHAAAMAARAPQVQALPDPVLGLTFFALPPETRVGPQRVSVSASQRLPWPGKRALAEKAALSAALAAAAKAEAVALEVVTEARRLIHELAFLDAHDAILRGERRTLDRYEEAARARYTAGRGLQQGIVRIQAQITRADTRILEIAERRASLLAAFNALRDADANRPVSVPASAPPQPLTLDRAALVGSARSARPELAAAAAKNESWEARLELAGKGYRPDWTVGLAYTLVDHRDDLAALSSPPAGNGDDILALTGSINLPMRRGRLDAAVAEAEASLAEAREMERGAARAIESEVGDLVARIPLLEDHRRLLEGVLEVQAREALRSAESAYRTGGLNAVDLLDAEVVLFEVRLAIERTRADLHIARARLERAVAAPVVAGETDGRDEGSASNDG